jgi:hypothetical protein
MGAYSAEESESLPIHVAHCEERYKTVFDRLKRIETLIWSTVGAVIVGMGSIILILLPKAFQ